MKGITRLLVLGFLIPFTWSCLAGTNVRSQRDPQFKGEYHKILVFVNFGDWRLRQDAERQFQKTLAMYRLEAVPSSDLFFLGRSYSEEEAAKMIADSEIQAILIVTAAESGTSASWIPQTTQTQGSATVAHNTVFGQMTQRTYGGFYVQKPWAEYDASMLDLKSGATVWIARMSSQGNAFADWGFLARSMARTTSEQLLKDHILNTMHYFGQR